MERERNSETWTRRSEGQGAAARAAAGRNALPGGRAPTMGVVEWLNTLALAHGACGVLLTVSSIFGDPDLMLFGLDVFCAIGSVLWLQHIESFGGSFEARAMFVSITISTTFGAVVVLAKRRRLPRKDPSAEESGDEAEGDDDEREGEELPEGMNGYELMASVMGGGPALKKRTISKSLSSGSVAKRRTKRSRR